MRYTWIFVAAAMAALSGCGPIRARPDLKVSTLTQPDQAHCVRGYKTRSTGTVGQYDAQVVEVTGERCREE
ncbi:hypothetical protein [Luteibacter yeojuensis]|uniref:Lipoprotein n=1 Tax=Luteibacter yeojuensis TaxID=345309 RepID=A0A7X5QU10_9GAMM|nr:hypothetical protein [Luteibacter yeojuensis]NID15418.1 hypothetical protein [Luteibacter yeojuensis]